MSIGWLYVATTVLLTVYGQLIVKWRVGEAGAMPGGTGAKIAFLGGIVLDPWVLSALAGAFVAALSWMGALTHFELSRAYPFVGLSFVLVLLGGAAFFGESLSAAKILGVGLIVLGVYVGTR